MGGNAEIFYETDPGRRGNIIEGINKDTGKRVITTTAFKRIMREQINLFPFR